MKRLNTLHVLIILLPVVHLNAQSAEEILSAYYQAVSPEGIKDWYTIKTARIESWSDFDNAASAGITSFRQPDSTLHITQIKWPDKSRADLFEKGEPTSLFLTIGNKRYIRIGNMPVMEQLSGEFFQFMPVRIREMEKNASQLSYLSETQVKGKSCHLIELVAEDRTWHLMFDTQTNLLHGWSHNPYDKLPTLTILERYSDIDGFLIPWVEYKEVAGQIFFYARTASIQLNILIDDSIFSID